MENNSVCFLDHAGRKAMVVDLFIKFCYLLKREIHMQKSAFKENIETFKEFFKNSSILDADKEFWMRMLENATTEMVDIMLAFFQEFPDSTQWIIDITKRKVEAFKTADYGSWDKILVDEGLELDKLLLTE